MDSKTENSRRRPLLTVDDLAWQLQCSPATIYRKRSLRLPLPAAIRIGRQVRWTQESIDEFLADNAE
ncbi:MAG: helix-turn-helix transcriptional regulator [Leucobacter sp.]